MSTVKEYYTWNHVERFIDAVAEHFKDQTFPGVYGIPRGGIVLATLISYRMNLPMLFAPCKGCIIVDDISDSGETLMHYRNNSSGKVDNRYHIVTMFYNESSAVKPDFYQYLKTDKWIVYPWEEAHYYKE